jgi:hypothetical protein
VVGPLLAFVTVVYVITKSRKKEITQKAKEAPSIVGLPYKIVKSVSSGEASQAGEELRIFSIEREILGDAIRRLYEAHAEGKISEEERERIARTYKSRMMVVKESILKDESLVALHELEAMQEDLVKLFSDRFDDLNTKIDELRSKVKVEPIKEIPVIKAASTVSTQEEPSAKKAVRKRRKEKPSPKTEAEKRIEKIRSEVEKVLDRLGQMEIET